MERPSEIIEDILTSHGISPTPVRILVYRTIASSSFPLSLIEIEDKLETVDRSSISRALNLFKKKNIVHFFTDLSGSMKYEPCHSDNHLHLNDTHVHFYCNKCHKTYCLHSLRIPVVNIPENFKLQDSNFILSGICDNCNHKKKSNI